MDRASVRRNNPVQDRGPDLGTVRPADIRGEGDWHELDIEHVGSPERGHALVEQEDQVHHHGMTRTTR
jgi:hypothetical protein